MGVRKYSAMTCQISLSICASVPARIRKIAMAIKATVIFSDASGRKASATTRGSDVSGNSRSADSCRWCRMSLAIVCSFLGWSDAVLRR